MRADAKTIRKWDGVRLANIGSSEVDRAISRELQSHHLLTHPRQRLHNKHALLRIHAIPSVIEIHSRDLLHDNVLCPDMV
jgi:hypothetical protein